MLRIVAAKISLNYRMYLLSQCHPETQGLDATRAKKIAKNEIYQMATTLKPSSLFNS